MIEIKSWRNGKVLYTAENATDVKTALEEAAKAKADLRSANLGYANLGYANLGSADLRSADLGSANLRYANLGYADLRSADLGSADGHRHPLWQFQADLWSILDRVPAEVAGLRQHIVDGLIDGSVYTGKCACLVGTIAVVRHVSLEELDIPRDGGRPAEQWFGPIREGDRPLSVGDLPEDVTEGVFRASWALRWLDEWTESRQWIGGVLGGGKAA